MIFLLIFCGDVVFFYILLRISKIKIHVLAIFPYMNF